MSRQDDAGLAGQGIRETPRADKARAEYVNHICKVVPIEVARQLERELNQSIKERDELKDFAVWTQGQTTASAQGWALMYGDAMRERDEAIRERDEYKESAAYVSALTKENATQRREMHKAQDALAHLIKLHQREVETGQPISGEDWEIAGYALGDE